MIHIIWHGEGFLVAVFIFGFSLIANLIANSVTGSGIYWETHKWPFALSLLVSAGICWSVGDYLRKRSDRIVIDKQTGKEFVLNQSEHTLFFIPMHWWSPILFVVAVVLLAIEFWH